MSERAPRPDVAVLPARQNLGAGVRARAGRHPLLRLDVTLVPPRSLCSRRMPERHLMGKIVSAIRHSCGRLARMTVKAVNDELARLGHQARLVKGTGFFYFWTGEAAGWIDRTVQVPKISALTLEQ